MSTPSKINEHQLGPQTLRMRERGMSTRAISEKLTERCGEYISYKAVQRYLDSVDAQTVAVAHRPEIVEANVEMTLDVGQRLRDALVRLDNWQEEAEAMGEDGPNWQARLGVMREAREHHRLYTELLDRLYRVEQAQALQRAVLRAFENVSPELRRQLQVELNKERAAVQASLLGVGR